MTRHKARKLNIANTHNLPYEMEGRQDCGHRKLSSQPASRLAGHCVLSVEVLEFIVLKATRNCTTNSMHVLSTSDSLWLAGWLANYGQLSFYRVVCCCLCWFVCKLLASRPAGQSVSQRANDEMVATKNNNINRQLVSFGLQAAKKFEWQNLGAMRIAYSFPASGKFQPLAIYHALKTHTQTRKHTSAIISTCRAQFQLSIFLQFSQLLPLNLQWRRRKQHQRLNCANSQNYYPRRVRTEAQT